VKREFTNEFVIRDLYVPEYFFIVSSHCILLNELIATYTLKSEQKG